MSRQKTPTHLALVTGAAIKNPQRYPQKKEPQLGRVGGPPPYLNDDEKKAWRMFVKELPWLRISDRCVLEIAARMRARLWTDPMVGTKQMTLLQRCCQSLGGSPAARAVLKLVDEKDEEPDEFFDDWGAQHG